MGQREPITRQSRADRPRPVASFNLTTTAGIWHRSSVIAIAGLIGIAPSQPSLAQSAGKKLPSFDIPSQPLSSALEAYSRATGVQVLYESRLATEVQSTPVNGALSQEAALQQIIKGSNLDIAYAKPGAVTLRPPQRKVADLPPSLLRSDLVLEPLRIRTVPTADRLRDFASVLKMDVQNALKRSGGTRQGNYTVGMTLFVDAQRQVRSPDIVKSTGNRLRDLAVARVLDGLVVSEAAPQNMPQPIRLVIVVRNM